MDLTLQCGTQHPSLDGHGACTRDLRYRRGGLHSDRGDACDVRSGHRGAAHDDHLGRMIVGSRNCHWGSNQRLSGQNTAPGATVRSWDSIPDGIRMRVPGAHRLTQLPQLE
eukprot:4496923-Prymnesium_polylepis.2